MHNNDMNLVQVLEYRYLYSSTHTVAITGDLVNTRAMNSMFILTRVLEKVDRRGEVNKTSFSNNGIVSRKCARNNRFRFSVLPFFTPTHYLYPRI